MSVVEIKNELEKMTDAERRVVIEFATNLINKEANGKRRLSLDEKRAKLKKSAEVMLSEYKNDKDLTALTELDGEDFLDA
jgi:hypothetical protein